MSDIAREAPTGAEPTFGSGLVPLLLLTTAYILNFVDRQILGVLAVPIKTDLRLTDTQLGMLGGIAFALFYTILGIPIARLADRTNRVHIIAICCATWSFFTAACGLAQNFTHLFLARMGVGIGEAGSTAPCYSLIPDMFAPKWRGRAFAIFQFGIPIGAAIGVFFGGWIAAAIGWRQAFMVIGLIGLPVSAIIWFFVREPVRGRFEGGDLPSQARVPLHIVFARLLRTPSFWLLGFGACCSAVQMYGLMFWLPSLFQRSFGLQLAELSFYFGSILLVGGIAGIWLGGWLVDRFEGKPKAFALVPAVALLLAGPFYALAITTSNLTLAFVLFLIPQALGLVGAAPIPAALQQVVHPTIRASTSAIYLLTTGIIGLGFGTYILGFMSDLMQSIYGDQSLKYSILYGLGFYLLASLLLFGAARFIDRDWARAQEPLS
jgi:predicted MFS family arabinose efflux permease